jgi:hypothetical protein
MKNTESVVNVLGELMKQYGETSPVGSPSAIREIIAGARRELEALTQAGIDVVIEQVETVTVVKPKSKRGRKAKKANG